MTALAVGDIVLVKPAKRRGKVTRLAPKGPDTYAVQLLDFQASHYYHADDLELVEKVITCGRCGQQIAQNRIPNNPKTWVSAEGGALCTWTGPGGQTETGAHYPAEEEGS